MARLFLVSKLFPGCLYVNFGEMLSDAENEECDKYAYGDSNGNAVLYMFRLNALKNQKIATKLLQKYPGAHGYLLSDDLGFIKDVWLSLGFQYVIGEYYHDAAKFAEEQRIEAEKKAANNDKPFGEDVYVAEQGGMTYVFVGSIKRVADSIAWEFVKSPQMREELNKGNFIVKGKCQYLSTIHEKYTCPVPFHEMIDLRYVQDGYLPPNFSAYDLIFIPQNISYYCGY